jgi:hypothetical protein
VTRLAAAIALLGLLTAAAPAAAQEFLRRIPDVVEPEPNGGPVRIDTRGLRVNFPVDPAELPQRLSVPLSEACGRLAFNQVQHGEYFVIITPRNGEPTRYGFANGNGFNLRDPEGLSGAEQVYLFFRDGTSECEVYAFAQP